jgi:hypothetical protein
VLALTEPDRTDAVAAAYRAAAGTIGVDGEVKQLSVAPDGAEIIDEKGRVTRRADARGARGHRSPDGQRHDRPSSMAIPRTGVEADNGARSRSPSALGEGVG